MSEHEHEHEHDEPCGCGQDGSPERQEGHDPLSCCAHGEDDGPEIEIRDPAGASLASALRTSFLLLGVLMVVAVGFFVQTGFVSVAPGQAAVRTVFGKVVGTTQRGLAINWPRPIGGIETIGVGERSVGLDEFWMHTTAEESGKKLRSREVPRGGLRPGLDGALLTGDRNLLHMRLKATYQIGRSADAPAEDPILLYWRNVPRAREGPNAGQLDANGLMKSVLAEAAIRSAGAWTADALQRSALKSFEGVATGFEERVKKLAQQRLDALGCGILLGKVMIDEKAWPLATLADYDAANRAISEAEAKRSNATAEALRVLNATAGPAYVKLVGNPDDIIRARPGSGPGDASAEYDLIGRYERSSGAEAAALLDRIDAVLASGSTVGDASGVIAEAQGYRTSTIEAVKQRVKRFNELLPAYRKAPSFTMKRLWDETREEILSSAKVEKHYITSGAGRTVLRIDRDPAITRAIRRALMETSKEGGPGGAVGDGK